MSNNCTLLYEYTGSIRKEERKKEEKKRTLKLQWARKVYAAAAEK
jgi:hypothetical protein